MYNENTACMIVKMRRWIWFLTKRRTPKWDLLWEVAVDPLVVGSFGAGRLI
jgi:hypothetical protein